MQKRTHAYYFLTGRSWKNKIRRFYWIAICEGLIRYRIPPC